MEALARGAAEVQGLPPPPGLSPLRWRLLRLALDGKSQPCPDKLVALRDLSLREAFQLEDVAHHRQREALLLQDVITATPAPGGPLAANPVSDPWAAASPAISMIGGG